MPGEYNGRARQRAVNMITFVMRQAGVVQLRSHCHASPTFHARNTARRRLCSRHAGLDCLRLFYAPRHAVMPVTQPPGAALSLKNMAERQAEDMPGAARYEGRAVRGEHRQPFLLLVFRRHIAHDVASSLSPPPRLLSARYAMLAPLERMDRRR